jgi:5'(3')-deoxyribonucleotidase
LKPLTTSADISSQTITATLPIPFSEIGFDFDGVIADTAETFLRIACESYNYCSFAREDITNFELENCIDIPLNLVEKIFTDILMDSIKTGLQPMPGAIRVLEELSQTEPVTVVTARPISEPVLDWLELHGGHGLGTRVKVIATGDHNDKVRYLHEHGIRYFIDDRAATCEDLAREAITPIVFTQPWNENRHNFQTVSNWDDIRKMLLIPPAV